MRTRSYVYTPVWKLCAWVPVFHCRSVRACSARGVMFKVQIFKFQYHLVQRTNNNRGVPLNSKAREQQLQKARLRIPTCRQEDSIRGAGDGRSAGAAAKPVGVSTPGAQSPDVAPRVSSDTS